jgi:hypothetical protein
MIRTAGMADPVTGFCAGGPLDGRRVTVRTPQRFLAVDRAAGKSWVYRQAGDGWTVCVDHDDSLNYPDGATTGERVLDAERAWQAGVDSALDVIAVG